MSTLDTTDKFLKVGMNKGNDTGILNTDQRGKHNQSNSGQDSVRQHINSHRMTRFQVTTVGNDLRKKYLPGNLNIQKMYRMYIVDCQEKGIEPINKHM